MTGAGCPKGLAKKVRGEGDETGKARGNGGSIRLLVGHSEYLL